MRKYIFMLIAAAMAVVAEARTVSLDGKWTLDYWEQGKVAVRGPEQMSGVAFRTVEATVPGNVELDLKAAGVIDFEPEQDSNVYLLRRWEDFQWRYSRHFTTPSHGPEDYVYLTFGGIDCFSDIYLNGHLLGSTDNMLIEHRFEVSRLLAPAGEDNSLEVYIRSSIHEGRKHVVPLVSHRNLTRPESIYVRRAPHTYGWDIMPRLISAGLWRSVTLDVRGPVHIEDTFWSVDEIRENGDAEVWLDYALNLPSGYHDGRVKAEYTLSLGGKTKVAGERYVTEHCGRIRIRVPKAELWWPRGYGDPVLYDATLKIVDSDGSALDSKTSRLGIRTVALEMTPALDEEGNGQFRFIVNGMPFFARGSNWTPMDAFHSRDARHLEETFKIAVDLNCNMLRCWGGNVYEDHPFYDLCDENGILVWQDFSMACANYPQDEDFQRALAKEIRSVVLKLRGHTCLALWSGNNEDDQAMAWAIKKYGIDPNDDVVSRRTIPLVLKEFDPGRPYLPSSPYFSPEFVALGWDDKYLPEDHVWGGDRGYYKDSTFTGSRCLFASEMGYHGMPSRKSLEKMFSPGSVYPWTDPEEHTWNNDWLTKATRNFKEEGYTPGRNNLMLKQVNFLFGEMPTDLDRFILASQATQAEAMKFLVERFRGYKFAPRTGVLWWNLRDGWPILSDAIVDWYNNPKLAYWFIRNVHHNVCLIINDPEEGGYPLAAVNDTRKDVSGKVEVTDVATGKTVYKGKYSVEANGRSVITHIPKRSGQGMLLVTYTGENGETLRNHYLYGEIPFSLDQYRSWLEKTGIYNIR